MTIHFAGCAGARPDRRTGYQSQILLEAAAREACLSPFHFHRLFRSTFGETPHDFLTRRRIDHARRLLASGEMTVTEVCLEVGYSSLGSFSSKFQSLAGVAPTQYQREIRRGFGFQRHRRLCWCLPAISPFTARNARLQPPQ
jgi:AraC-like DNA-binding protein